MTPRPTPAASAWLPTRALWNLFLAGIVLRLLLVGYWSLWLDEGATWAHAVAPSWKDTILAEANHPPLWWIVTRIQVSLFGASEASLRAPAALLGIVAMGLAWLLALRLLVPSLTPRRGGFEGEANDDAGRRIAVWFAGVTAVAAYFLEYSQEARMYPALLAESLGLCLLYLRWLDKNDRLSLVLYAVVATLGLYTHYFAVWPILAHAAHCVWLARRTRGYRDAVRARPFLAAVAVSALLFLPWFAYLASNYAGLARYAPNPFGVLLHGVWRMGVGPALVVQDAVRAEQGPASVLAEEWPVVVASGVLWMVPLALGFVALRRRPGLRAFALANLLVPIGLLLALYAWFPLLQERYLIFLAPWVFLLVVLGAFSVPAVFRTLLLAGVVVLTAAGAGVYTAASGALVPEGPSRALDGYRIAERYVPDPESPIVQLGHGHEYGREPWRRVYDDIQPLAKSGDVVALHPWYLGTVWDYYAARGAEQEDDVSLATVLLPRLEMHPDELERRFGERLGSTRRVFLVLGKHETEERDYYVFALSQVLERVWEGFDPATVVRTEYRISWGLRLAVFTRP